MPSPTAADAQPFLLSAAAQGAVAYQGASTPIPPGAVRLDRNESAALADAESLLAQLDRDALRSYPDAAPLERDLAERFSLAPEQVVVTAGADDALDRLLRASVDPSRALLTHAPTFEMLEIFSRRVGAAARRVQWLDGPFPVEQYCAALDATTGCAALVSPNNPTGASIRRADIERVVERAAAVGALALLDQAYAEFASDAPQLRELLERGGVAVVRTFSKAWGLAGLRVGWLAAPEPLARVCRALGAPFAVSSASIAAARHALRTLEGAMQQSVARINREKMRLAQALRDAGVKADDSDANFVLARFDSREQAQRFTRSLATRGLIVRDYPPASPLAACVRITCPGDEAVFARLLEAVSGAEGAVS